MSTKKTALVLSGGGSRGAYECGVWQALSELDVSLDMVVGVSVGAINGAMVVQGDLLKTDNLWRQIETDMVFDVSADAKIPDFAKEFITHGGAGSTGLQKLLSLYLDETAIRKSDIDFGLLTVEMPSLKPHYLWIDDIPEGKLADYITASASAFPAIHTHKIEGKEFIDGGFENNLPVPMAWEHGATDIIAVFLSAPGKFFPEQVTDIPNLRLIKSSWDLGDFLVFDKLNAAKIIRLGYLDTMKSFEVFDGEYYTFVKGCMDKRSLKQGDAAARIFDLNPSIIYRKEHFMETIKEKIQAEKTLGDVNISLKGITNVAKIKNLLKLANRKTLTLFIAENIIEKGGSSIFLSKYAHRVLQTEIDAARFIIKNEFLNK